MHLEQCLCLDHYVTAIKWHKLLIVFGILKTNTHIVPELQL
jgi:hypothetical protein